MAKSESVVVSAGPDGALELDRQIWRTIDDVARDNGVILINPFRLKAGFGLCFSPEAAGYVASVLSNWLGERPELHRADSVSGYALRRFAHLGWTARESRVRMRVFARAA